MGLVLLTGATGYLGSHLLDSLLADGAPVRALVYSEWKEEELAERGVEVVNGDVTDLASLEGIADGVKIVYHLVGGGSVGGPDPFLINVQGTRNMLATCRDAELDAFVYVSSSTVYGRQTELLDEDTPPSPTFDYPESKLEAEKVLLEAYQESGFPAKIARLAGIYGPDAPMLGTGAVLAGRMRVTGEGQNTISVIHVDDAVRALRALAQHGRPGQVLCLGDDEPVPYRSFYSQYASLLNAPPIRTRSLRKVRTILRVVGFLSRLTGRKTPFSAGYLELPTLNVRMKNTRMRQELGVNLDYPTYRDGLAQVADFVLAEEEE